MEYQILNPYVEKQLRHRERGRQRSVMERKTGERKEYERERERTIEGKRYTARDRALVHEQRESGEF